MVAKLVFVIPGDHHCISPEPIYHLRQILNGLFNPVEPVICHLLFLLLFGPKLRDKTGNERRTKNGKVRDNLWTHSLPLSINIPYAIRAMEKTSATGSQRRL
jgi:hypothetical protein